MIRTQVQLTETQNRLLEELRARRHVSKAELLRQAVDEFLARVAAEVGLDEQRAKALRVVGRYHSGRTDVSVRHDDHLAEAYAEVQRE
jgi:hypothetical protein